MKNNYYTTFNEIGDDNKLTSDIPLKETLSERIKYALDRRGMRKIDLAKKIGVKHQTIQYLCKREIKNSRFTPLIADALKVDLQWLSTGKGTFGKNFSEGQLNFYEVPLLDEEGIQHLLQTNQLSTNKHIKRFIQSFTKVENEESCFAFLVTDTAMLPVFPKGSMVFINRYGKFENDVYGLFYVGNKDIVLRKIKKEKDETTLIVLNELLYKNISFNKKNDVFLGKVIEIRWSEHDEKNF